jgi:hypothetical protein
MEEIATISFKGPESADSGIVVIRAQKGIVGLALSLLKDGDLEVFLAPSDCQLVIDALRGALAKAL